MQWLVFALGLIPLGVYVRWFFENNLGPNPVEAILHASGDWTMYMLLASLTVTPARRLWSKPKLFPLRKTLGLLAFFYCVLHFGLWALLEEGLDVTTIKTDLTTKPFLMAGAFALAILIPLAFTSFQKAIQWLGGRNWNRLHKLVYVAAIVGIAHYFLLVKSDTSRPMIFAVILTVLLGLRVMYEVRSWAQARARR